MQDIGYRPFFSNNRYERCLMSTSDELNARLKSCSLDTCKYYLIHHILFSWLYYYKSSKKNHVFLDVVSRKSHNVQTL